MLVRSEPSSGRPFLTHLLDRAWSPQPEPFPMPSVQVHYDGWLALPEAVQRKLGVATGDRLEVEFADGALVLHPARPSDAAGRAGPEPPATAERPVERRRLSRRQPPRSRRR